MEILDGGEVVNDQFSHPRRVPKFHSASRVKTLLADFD
jgi:hypothetical protein